MPNFLKGRRSKSRLRIGPSRLDLTSSENPVPPLPSPDFIPYAPPASPPASGSLRQRTPLLGKKRPADIPPPVPPKGTEFTLDKDLDNMEGIVDLTIIQNGVYDGVPSSPSSGFESSAYSSALSSDVSSTHHQYHASTSSLPSGAHSMFNNPNPFQTPAAGQKRKLGSNAWDRKISPKTRAPFSASVPTIRGHDDPSWTAPESWAVDVGADDDLAAVAGDTSSDGEDPALPKTAAGGAARKNKRKRNTLSVSGKPPRAHDERDSSYQIRIYRRDNTYHVATISLRATVADLIPYLNNKMLYDTSRETHRLYLKERGRGKSAAFLLAPGCGSSL